MKRVGRKLWYSAGFLSILFLIAGGVYYAYFRPPPTCFDNILNQDETEIDCGGVCIACELKGLELEVGNTRVFSGGEKKVNLYTEITNPAENYDGQFTYEIEVFSLLGGRVAVFEENSFVEPGDTRYIVVPGVGIAEKDVGRVELNLVDFGWESATATERYPARIDGEETTVTEDEVQVVGVFQNEGSTPLVRVRITALLYDEDGFLLNASTADVKNIGSFQEKSFTVFFPEGEGLAETVFLELTKTFWEIIE